MAKVSRMQMRGAVTLSFRQFTTLSLRSRRRLAVQFWIAWIGRLTISLARPRLP